MAEPQVTIEIADGHPPVAVQEVPSNETFPSERCANREEWQETCRLWSGKPHNRYLLFSKIESREGIGANLCRIAWALKHAISFDVEPVIRGPLLAGHSTGDFGDWMGLTNNPFLAIQDPLAFDTAKHLSVPFPEGNSDAWFQERNNHTSVVFTVNTGKVDKLTDWDKPVSPPSAHAGVCKYLRESLRNIFWSVPQNRQRCHGLLPDGHHMTPEVVSSEEEEQPHDGNRPWTLAVHLRRGDTITFKNGSRSLPHQYYQATVNSVLRSIAATEPAAQVSILVFSEGSETLTGLQVVDEHGDAVIWDIAQESCLDIGLKCSQSVFLKTTALETFDCLASADIVVGSRSSFSDTVGAVSTNVKVLTRTDKTGQDRVTLNSKGIKLSGAVTLDEQRQMDTAVADWRHCSREARGLTGSTPEILTARRFYQTVDELNLE